MFSFIGKCFWSMAGICFLISVGIVLAGMNDLETIAPAVKFIQAAGLVVIDRIRDIWAWAAKGEQQMSYLALLVLSYMNAD